MYLILHIYICIVHCICSCWTRCRCAETLDQVNVTDLPANIYIYWMVSWYISWKSVPECKRVSPGSLGSPGILGQNASIDWIIFLNPGLKSHCVNVVNILLWDINSHYNKLQYS